MNEEIWKLCPGYESMYEVSCLGRVRRYRVNRFKPYEQILTPTLVRGYSRVTMHSESGIQTSKVVHRLVALAFLSPEARQTQVHHKNGKKSDNRVENLQWVTPRQNRRFAVEMNQVARKEDHPMVKLTLSDIRYIRSQKGIKLGTHLAKEFGVSKSTICCILNNQTWKENNDWFESGAGI